LRPLCTKCSHNFVETASRVKGATDYTDECNTCRRGYSKAKFRHYTQYKKDFCENPKCIAIITHSCQLDVDHIDGNKANNDPSNLMTLCANCHRLKTLLNKDYLSPEKRVKIGL
jgi:5-methylcytosine-specific restriction endonuclease McrA